MTTVLEYLEEETAFIPDPDMPASVANSLKSLDQMMMTKTSMVALPAMKKANIKS
jgi:hypothetical protein